MTFIGIYAIGLAAILGLMTLLWLVSLRLKNSSIVDIFWGAGFVVAAWWYVESRPPVSAREALAGNLCRCTGYQGLVAAVTQVAEEVAASDGERS